MCACGIRWRHAGSERKQKRTAVSMRALKFSGSVNTIYTYINAYYKCSRLYTYINTFGTVDFFFFFSFITPAYKLRRPENFFPPLTLGRAFYVVSFYFFIAFRIIRIHNGRRRFTTRHWPWRQTRVKKKNIDVTQHIVRVIYCFVAKNDKSLLFQTVENLPEAVRRVRRRHEWRPLETITGTEFFAIRQNAKRTSNFV